MVIERRAEKQRHGNGNRCANRDEDNIQVEEEKKGRAEQNTVRHYGAIASLMRQ